MKNRLFTLVFFAFLAEKGFSQIAAWPFEKAIDSLVFHPKWADDQPGFSVLIVQNGQIVYEKQRGLADLKTKKKIDSTTRFNIGSITKTFTAQAILLLEERGLLKTSDPVANYLPEFRHFGAAFTIDRLLSNTSGAPDHLEAIGLRRNVRKRAFRPDFAVKWLEKLPAPSFAPGSDFVYSNSGFMLLAEIVERVSGQKFDVFVRDHIFQPLKMDGATVAFSQKEGLPEGVSTYAFDSKKGKFKLEKTFDNALGATGVFCSLRDLVAWSENFSNNQLGQKRPDLIEKMKKPAVLTDGSTVGYGAGLFSHPFRGEKMIGHSGGWAGFLTQWRYFPDRKTTVLVASNNDRTNPFPIADQICERIFSLAEPPFLLKTEPPPSLDFSIFEGRFISQSNLIRRVLLDSTGLSVSLSWSLEGKRFSRLSFEKKVGDSLVVFRDAGGDELFFKQKGSKIDGFWWAGGHFVPHRSFYKKLDAPADAARFVGKYASETHRQKLKIKQSRRTKQLFLKPIFFLKFPLVTLGPNVFLVRGESVVVRFESGEMIVGNDWVRGLRLKKRG